MSPTVRPQPDHGPRHRAARAGVAAVAALAALSPAAASADQTVRLGVSFERQRSSVSFRVPDGWTLRLRARGTGASLTAPSSRRGCEHVIDADLNALHVSSTTSSAGWVASRLHDRGTLLAASLPAETSWAVVARRRATTSAGAGARITGQGRYGPIMTEVLFGTRLSGSCPAGQGTKAARRLGRVLPSLAITAARR